ncbi:MAG: protein-L-isoaspartate(D-aspartate) O-methyltransferase [Candidatus Aenigmarchaeota archaeon]|nr:protein-L-isoaspartate(D-aspartate) O-methyltransferase [Candidatus Aenigmarchaeota archaeon]
MLGSKTKLIWVMKQKGFLTKKDVAEAIYKTPREWFVGKNVKGFAYEDVPLSIGHGATISQPSTVAIMIEALDVKKTDKILEIGTGSGWQTAILAHLTKKNVYSIEIVKELVKFAKENIKKTKLKNIRIIEGDGSKGYKKYAPYDKIIVSAASPSIPDTLIKQLKVGGKLVIPVGDYQLQELILVEKISKTKIKKKKLGKFRFVALLGRYGFQKKDQK